MHSCARRPSRRVSLILAQSSTRRAVAEVTARREARAVPDHSCWGGVCVRAFAGECCCGTSSISCPQDVWHRTLAGAFRRSPWTSHGRLPPRTRHQMCIIWLTNCSTAVYRHQLSVIPSCRTRSPSTASFASGSAFHRRTTKDAAPRGIDREREFAPRSMFGSGRFADRRVNPRSGSLIHRS